MNTCTVAPATYRFVSQYGWLEATSLDAWKTLSQLTFTEPVQPDGTKDPCIEPPIVNQTRHYLLGDDTPCPALHLTGTDFQQDVWQALRDIPLGETRSYAQVATAIGRPFATRAVGTACGNNPLALLIPCHRVLQSNGDLGGYRWGTERKWAILRAEGVEAFQ